MRRYPTLYKHKKYNRKSTVKLSVNHRHLIWKLDINHKDIKSHISRLIFRAAKDTNIDLEEFKLICHHSLEKLNFIKQ